MIQSKRPLPSTPGTNTKYKNDNTELLLDKHHGSLTDGERKWYNDIHKSIEQKDVHIISSLSLFFSFLYVTSIDLICLTFFFLLVYHC